MRLCINMLIFTHNLGNWLINETVLNCPLLQPGRHRAISRGDGETPAAACRRCTEGRCHDVVERSWCRTFVQPHRQQQSTTFKGLSGSGSKWRDCHGEVITVGLWSGTCCRRTFGRGWGPVMWPRCDEGRLLNCCKIALKPGAEAAARWSLESAGFMNV